VEAFKEFNKVDQPFLDLIDPQYKSKVREVAAGRSAMDSILNCYYSGKDNVFAMQSNHH